MNSFFYPKITFLVRSTRLSLVGAGVLDAPRTWSGTMSLQVSDAHLPEVNFQIK